jgi:hypothetical protein
VPDAREPWGWRTAPGFVLAGLVAGVVVWIAYDEGSYKLQSIAPLAISVFWGIAIGLGLGVLSARGLPRATAVVVGVVTALALWTLASVAWAPSAEDAFNDFNRVSLYLGVYVFVVLAATRETVGRWADALAIAIVTISAIALVSRLFPGSFPDRDIASFLPSVATRLNFPLGYWNGLGILLGFGVPLLLRIALVARGPVMRGLAVAPLAAMAATIYLTSSRGGIATALVSTIAFVALTERRWSAVAALVVAGAGAAAAVAALLDRNDLVNGPLGSDLARDQGRSAAVVIGLACVASGVVYGLGVWRLGPRLHPGRTIGRAAVGVTAVLLVVGVAASDPVERFQTFKRLPQEGESIDPDDFAKAHLLSSSGSGRWQVWSSAVDQWQAHGALGEGAGTFESWWAEHASISLFVRNAHSLYLEALGELGPLGLLLTIGVVLLGVATGVRRSLLAEGETRVTIAALTAAFLGYAFAAGFDWVWELTALSVVAFSALALISGPATAVLDSPRLAKPGESPSWVHRRRLPLGIVIGISVWLLLCAQAIPLLADRQIARSRTAVAERDLRKAAEAAEAARDIQPWAATPYLQLALVNEEAGDVVRARRWINEAIERDPRDWRLWLVSARLETKVGRVTAAERSLRRAAELNPRSPLFRGLLGGSSGS